MYTDLIKPKDSTTLLVVSGSIARISFSRYANSTVNSCPRIYKQSISFAYFLKIFRYPACKTGTYRRSIFFMVTSHPQGASSVQGDPSRLFGSFSMLMCFLLVVVKLPVQHNIRECDFSGLLRSYLQQPRRHPALFFRSMHIARLLYHPHHRDRLHNQRKIDSPTSRRVLLVERQDARDPCRV